MLAYYAIDFIRCISLLLSMIPRFKAVQYIYVTLWPNEIFLLGIIIALPVNRESFPMMLCSGDYPYFFFDITMPHTGWYIYVMMFLVPLYSFLVCWTIYIVMALFVAKKILWMSLISLRNSIVKNIFNLINLCLFLNSC